MGPFGSPLTLSRMGWASRSPGVRVPSALYWLTRERDAIPFCASVFLPVHDKVGVLGVCSLTFSVDFKYKIVSQVELCWRKRGVERHSKLRFSRYYFLFSHLS